MDKLVSIIRKPDGLVALVSRPRCEFKVTLSRSIDNSFSELANHYESVETPLELISAKLYPKKDKILSAWNYIKKVQILNEILLTNILLILLETQIDYSKKSTDLPILELNNKENITKPTAAHPRAYQGTKYKPPKIKQFQELNLVPYLCDEKNIKIILQKLEDYFDIAIQNLNNIGYKLDIFLSINKEEITLLNPYFIFHHSLLEEDGKFKLPSLFAKYILPLLKGARWQDVLQFLKVFWKLELDKKKNLLFSITRLLHLSHNSNILKWCEIIALQPHKRRAIFITLLIKSNAYLIKANSSIIKAIDEFNFLTPNKYYISRLWFFFLALRKNTSTSYILVGFSLANKYQPDYQFTEFHSGPNLSIQAIEKLVNYLKDTDKYYNSLALSIWEKCGFLEGLIDVIKQLDWYSLPVDIAFSYLRFFLNFAYCSESEKTIKIKWGFLKQQINQIDSRLRTIDSTYKLKFLDALDNFYWYWDSIKNLSLYTPTVYILLERLCCLPFKSYSYFYDITISFIDFSERELIDLVISAPNSSFLNLEKACYSKNASYLIDNAIYSLMKYLPEFTVNAFVNFSSKLFKVAKFLGSFNRPIRYLIIQEFKKHQIMISDFTSTNLEEAFLIIENIANKKISNPIPDKLKSHTYKEIILDQQKLNYYKEQFYKQLYLTKLDILEEITVNTLKKDYLITNEHNNVRYTLQLAAYIDENKRPLRKFLKAYFAGDKNYLYKHPRAQAWLKKHAYLDFMLWTQGISLKQESKKHGFISIELEKDLMEALKLGAYVGSCLEVGGGFTYSAAAVVLDINKQVLYARNEKNEIIARQLIAISEEKKLVCFEVYPVGIDKEIKSIFRDYDVNFAKELKMDLTTNGEYTIENILSENWWDDYAWDLT